MRLPARFAVVAGGGAVGGLLRYGATRLVPEPAVGFAWTTLGINVLGSLVLGFLMAGVLTSEAPAWLRPALGTGLLGGFTTFSAVSQSVQLTGSSGHAGTALAYLVASVVVSVAAAAVGLGIGARWAVRHGEHEADLHPDALPGSPPDWADT